MQIASPSLSQSSHRMSQVARRASCCSIASSCLPLSPRTPVAMGARRIRSLALSSVHFLYCAVKSLSIRWPVQERVPAQRLEARPGRAGKARFRGSGGAPVMEVKCMSQGWPAMVHPKSQMGL